jgi:PKD repeat protein
VRFRLEAFDPDGTILRYELDFGDDTASYEWSHDYRKPGDNPQLTHSHVYAEAGTYNVKLKVFDNSEENTETTVVLTITDPPKPMNSNGSQ